MAVNFLVIGDPHFKVNNIRDTDPMVTTFLELARREKPDYIVVLGDTLDRHESIHVSPLCRAVKFLQDLSTITEVFLLIGNHDLINNRQFLSDTHPFTALKNWNNITVVDTTVAKVLKGQTFVFVPYVPPGRFQEALDKVDNWKQATAIFCHQEFKGCNTTATLKSTEGDYWALTNPYVIAGHIHEYHEPQINIIYIGTSYQVNFGDSEDKTVSWFSFHNQERVHKKLDLGLTKKISVILEAAEVGTYVPRENCYLKITIRGTAGENKALHKHPNIESWRKMGCIVDFRDIPLNKTDTLPDEKRENKPSLKFSQALHRTIIANYPNLEPLFTKLFGTVKPSGIILNIIKPVVTTLPSLSTLPSLPKLSALPVLPKPLIPTLPKLSILPKLNN